MGRWSTWCRVDRRRSSLCAERQGILVCLKLADGKEVWRKDLRDLGGEVPNWGYSESPLIDGKLVLCTPGGAKGTVAAFNKLSENLSGRART